MIFGKFGDFLGAVPEPAFHTTTKSGMRGGISVVTHRYAEANNKYMASYDPSKPSSYILYLDANNLYGWAMSQYLPTGNYEWSNRTFSREDILAMTDDQSTGYIFQCDLSVPVELHDYFNDYPLLPESTSFDASPFMMDLQAKCGTASVQTQKLIPNLKDKKDYVIHYRNLKQALELGIVLDKVHRVLSFDQSPFLKSFIDFNTDKRSMTKVDYEKDLFKLMNNSVFGKTMENVEKRRTVKLVTDEEKLLKLASKPHFKSVSIYNEGLCAVEMAKEKINQDKPMIVGMCILELSKTLMYNFHYNVIKKKYGDKAKLCFTDTDSLTYHIQTEDVYADMASDLSLYDTSDYPSEHLCFSNANKKVIGKFKDETSAKPIIEFVGLRSKMYSIKLSEEKNKATGKGIKKSAMRKIKHQNYRDALFGQTAEQLRQMVSFNLIRSQEHHLQSLTIHKVGLYSFDDKRYVLDDNIHTLAHGHYKINSA
jgi:hypothetical protein